MTLAEALFGSWADAQDVIGDADAAADLLHGLISPLATPRHRRMPELPGAVRFDIHPALNEYGRLSAKCDPLTCRAQMIRFGAWLGVGRSRRRAGTRVERRTRPDRSGFGGW